MTRRPCAVRWPACGASSACKTLEVGVEQEEAQGKCLATLARFVKRNDFVVRILTGHIPKNQDFTIKFHRGDLFPDKDQSVGLKTQQRAPI